MKSKRERKQALMPNGIPRYVRSYEETESFYQYTIVFTGHYRKSYSDDFLYLGMSENPFHPQGFAQHGSCRNPIDRPTYSHLGKKIRFESLPENCKKLVISEYKEIWKL